MEHLRPRALNLRLIALVGQQSVHIEQGQPVCCQIPAHAGQMLALRIGEHRIFGIGDGVEFEDVVVDDHRHALLLQGDGFKRADCFFERHFFPYILPRAPPSQMLHVAEL